MEQPLLEQPQGHNGCVEVKTTSSPSKSHSGMAKLQMSLLCYVPIILYHHLTDFKYLK